MPASPSDIELLAAALRQVPGLSDAVARDKKRYSSLPYCVLAAIFSINARYTTVIAAVRRYRDYYHLPPIGIEDVPPNTPEPTVSDLISQVEAIGADEFASNVLKNRGRTSSKSGILKAQAAYDYAKVLRSYGIEVIADVLACQDLAKLETALRQVHGQASGVSTDYFMMNVGDMNRVKPDRRVIGFLHDALGRTVSQAEAQSLFIEVCPAFTKEYPGMTPRALDLVVWEWKSNWNDAAPSTLSKRQALELRIAATEQRLERLRQRLKQLDS